MARLYVYQQKAWHHLKSEALCFLMIPLVSFQGHASCCTTVWSCGAKMQLVRFWTRKEHRLRTTRNLGSLSHRSRLKKSLTKSMSSCKISRQKFMMVVDVEQMEIKFQTSDSIKSSVAQSNTIPSYTRLPRVDNQLMSYGSDVLPEMSLSLDFLNFFSCGWSCFRVLHTFSQWPTLFSLLVVLSLGMLLQRLPV